ncbi:unnamed protein product [Staurois parvus]|uniref:Uncharacterized protein n=1 Tax=Staurois parvus TaxID=386267 RepID=A0ABN9BR87_9NEOB|nr:unnamed protein product [Staurois parvus]
MQCPSATHICHFHACAGVPSDSAIIGVSGRNSIPSLVSVGGIVPHHWCQWMK